MLRTSFIRILTTAFIVGVAYASAPAPYARSQNNRPVIADYLVWHNPSTFDGRLTWDVPADGPYDSSDIQTIQRHIRNAQEACLDGFAVHWFGPDDPITTDNFERLLDASVGTSLRHAIVIQANTVPNADEDTILDSVLHIMDYWMAHPNYLKLDGRAVILFTDMPRPWGSDAAALEGWRSIRESADPDRETIWMAEGLYPTYNPLFDGLYVYRIDHRDYPKSWLKQPRWAAGLRKVQKQSKMKLYFADTIAAGFDDTRSARLGALDYRSPQPAFARDRQNGQYYRETFAPTAKTGGDFLLVKSFNEWIEGTQIEPGKTYGDLYLRITCELVAAYKSR